MTRQKPQEAYLLLHNIRSTYNVGSIFRTADAAGITKIYLSGYTPTPLDRFGREVKEFSKTSLGSVVPWEYKKNPLLVIRELKKKVTQVIALEQDPKSVDYKKVKPKFPVLFIVGNEVTGISESLLKQVDIIAEIPMKGKKESLNVAVSLGIALFRILNI
ncbi:TrmH family RNA methyltransferase [Candidatus Parcubacteria bacterium]|nr:TrmH family RNA methyltransferase [Candidatus Parcubacteria bacterium]